MSTLLRMFVACVFLALIVGTHSATVFFEPFDSHYSPKWIVSQSPNYEGKWKHSAPDDTKDYGLLVSEKAKKYGIATVLPSEIDPKSDAIVLQYDLRLQNGIECAGAYLKFLTPQGSDWTADQLTDSSPYSVMFGPDKCGSTNKVHFIFRHKDPSGEFKEHHLVNPPAIINDKLSHVYTAVVYPNNTLHVLIDGKLSKSADLLSYTDFSPPVLPAKTIPDPEDKKPEDWDERAKIKDPEATKPEDWDESAPKLIEDLSAVKPEGWLDDEPLEIDDPEATKPEEWNDEEDGDWEPSRIPNPACESAPGCGEWKRPTKKNPDYKGKWTAPLIDNPAYKGKWKPQEIPNPAYFHLDRPNLEPVAAVAIEIWTMTDGILFDNILVADDVSVAESYRSSTWKPKFDVEKAAEKLKEKEVEEEVKKASAPAGKNKPLDILKDKVFGNLHKVAELSALKSVKKDLKRGLAFLESKDEYAYATIALLFILLVLTIAALLPGKKKKPSAVSLEQAKKEDISSPDDEITNEAEKEKESVSAPVDEVKTDTKEEKDDIPAAEKGSGEIVEEIQTPEAKAGSGVADEVEEVKDDEDAVVRRRSRRQT